MTSEEYAQLKLDGQLVGNEVLLSEGQFNTSDSLIIYQGFISQPEAVGCSGYTDPSGPSLPVTSLDDGWVTASPLTLPFNFCFFGSTQTQVWVNNNGNISFNGGISSFTSNAFPSTGNEMIAAFWADVDLTGAGTVHATVTPTYAIFNWVDVGYFNGQTDKKCSFQIIISDGVDPIIFGGNVAIHYADMQWTTGSASGGTNGFGGTPATVGANRGNNVDFFQIGRFDHEGVDYDGPNGVNDGVSWLDDKSFYFDFCTTSNGNIEPIPLNTQYCDTFKVCSVGDSIDISFPFLSPENSQTTTVTYSSPTLTSTQIISNVSGASGEITIRIDGSQEAIGVHDITITATDDFTPAGVTTVSYWVEVTDAALAFPVTPSLDYTMQCAPVTFSILNGPFDGYLWETGDVTPTLTMNNYFNDTLSVVLVDGGCKFYLDSVVMVPANPYFNIQGSLDFCASTNSTFIEIGDSISMGSITWGLSDQSLDTIFSNYLLDGTYTLHATDLTGLCSSDTTFTVIVKPSPQIFGDTVACNFGLQVGGTQSFNGGTWFASDTSVHFNPSNTVDNPLITTTNNNGVIYTVTYIDNECNDTLTADIDFPPYPWTYLSDTVLCQGVTFNLTAPNENNYPTTYEWNDGTTTETISITQAGTYTVLLNNICHSGGDTVVIDYKLCDIAAPNVISLAPGSQNQTWYVKADGLKEFNLVITNRWGSVIYECNDPQANCHWDGRDRKGDFVGEGTYFYLIDAKTEGGEELQKHGFIQVVD